MCGSSSDWLHIGHLLVLHLFSGLIVDRYAAFHLLICFQHGRTPTGGANALVSKGTLDTATPTAWRRMV